MRRKERRGPGITTAVDAEAGSGADACVVPEVSLLCGVAAETGAMAFEQRVIPKHAVRAQRSRWRRDIMEVLKQQGVKITHTRNKMKEHSQTLCHGARTSYLSKFLISKIVLHRFCFNRLDSNFDLRRSECWMDCFKAYINCGQYRIPLNILKRLSHSHS